MAVNKVVYGTTVLVDLTSDTVDSDSLLQGKTAHTNAGEQITGTVKFATIYSGSSEPSSSLGSDGDIYLMV